MPYIQYYGKQCYYSHSKEKEDADIPVILIHGSGGLCYHWPPQIRLNKEYLIYSLDLPGHGRSRANVRVSVHKYAMYVKKFLDELKIKQAILCGHSLGGAVSLDFTVHYPNRVKALCLLATGAELPVSELVLKFTSSESNKSKFAKLLTKVAYGKNVSPDLVKAGKYQVEKTPMKVFHNDFSACNDYDLNAKIDSIQKPCLIFCGDSDKMTPLPMSENLHSKIANSQLKIIKDCGHMLMLENSELVCEEMLSFIGSQA